MLQFAYERNIIAIIDISSPSNGRARNAPVRPRADAMPMPQAAHPGAMNPRNIPVVPSMDDFICVFLIWLVLYIVSAMYIPNRSVIIIKLIAECVFMVLGNPIK